MELTLIGYGKMGQMIHNLAIAHKHQITDKFNSKNSLNPDVIKDTICIDFTNAKAFASNYKIIADNCQAAVIGTTGWDEIKQDVFDYFNQRQKTLVFGSNFSLGANIYFTILKNASKLLAEVGGYDPYLLEMHHHEKKDAPSGTAKSIANILQAGFKKKVNPVSVRSGWIRGVHEVGYESQVDKIVIKHEAYTRDGFASGALLAAEWSATVKGVWNFQDLLANKLQR